ncbi:5'-3' exonuclease [Hoyosella rhizosphaerae]|uniref:5'-3' exonuclease n=1 Tax=Hoyosella rhizosphaerae TaxID=1755582 RepID=A0A916U092_9ACTN|nr:5'-3' exonuclease [Hoyosella rhizosphaerae]MBN4927074.1 5'-3' exonuclease [Hoyosella rhizosphaerae]GGC54263.1 5'-3' exonuclease [Hoyosella rhizosphaerae]
MQAPILLLDGASLWYRSFHALPESLTAPDGRPVNAVRGFLDTIASLIRTHQPSRLVVCLDNDWRPSFRVDAIPSYKEHRVAESGGEDEPESLPAQVEMILDVLDAVGIATAGADGFEADDVLGTLAARESVDPVIVVSGDRDLLQVVDDGVVPVQVLYVGRGLAKAELFDPAGVAAKFDLPIERAGVAYAEFALLRGDPSDGLPGVAGVGEKTASRLLTEYGSLDGIIAAAHDNSSALASGLRAKLLAATDYIAAAKNVVAVATDAPISLSRSDLLPTAPSDRHEIADLSQHYGIENSVKRLLAALAENTGAVSS